MALDLEHLACPGCMEMVFAGREALLCNRCDTYQHRRCWNEVNHCVASSDCKGKPRDVVVLRMEAAGPTADEIADATDNVMSGRLLNAMEEIRQAVIKRDTVEVVRPWIEENAKRTEQKVETIRGDVRSSVDGVRAVLHDLEKGLKEIKAAAAERPDLAVSEQQLRRLVEETTTQAERTASMLREHVERVVSSVRSELKAEIFRVQQAIEACRWDTGARRHPLPWDERPDEVFIRMPGETGGEG